MVTLTTSQIITMYAIKWTLLVIAPVLALLLVIFLVNLEADTRSEYQKYKDYQKHWNKHALSKKEWALTNKAHKDLAKAAKSLQKIKKVR